VAYLPRCSPHLNPVETIWRRVKGSLMPRRHCRSVEELRGAVAVAMERLREQLGQGVLQSLCIGTYEVAHEGISSSNYENTEQDGDLPFAIWYDRETYRQRDFGDFNLSDRPTVYYIPEELVVASLPQEALNNAVYGPVRIRYATEDELRDVNWFKTQLAAGREVAFAVVLTQATSDREREEEFRGGIWRPLSAEWAGHAMLMVGYDDARRAFMVKNSWGRTRDGKGLPTGADTDGDGFIEMSYDWVTRGLVYEAAVLLAVVPPSDSLSAPHPSRFLGRWKMSHDGWGGILDLYHLPGMIASRWLGGRADLRLGTYYGPDGVARRVNGVIVGNRIDFWIDWDTPDLAVNQLQGMHFTGYLMRGYRYLAGDVDPLD
jgi:hypothetical protein